MIGLYQELGWETVTALFLPETTDSLFLPLRPSHGQPGSNPKVRLADNSSRVECYCKMPAGDASQFRAANSARSTLFRLVCIARRGQFSSGSRGSKFSEAVRTPFF